jgi:O-antigen ligase
MLPAGSTAGPEAHERIRMSASAVLVLTALVFGGGVRGMGDLIVYATAALVVGVLVAFWRVRPRNDWCRAVDLLVFAALALCVLQLLPLPVALTTSGGERAVILAELRAAGTAPGLMAISLDRWATLRALLATAVFAVVWWSARQVPRAQRIRLIKAALVVALPMAVLGIVQALGKPDATGGQAFFTSRNHFAALLTMLLPFAIAAACCDRPAALWVRLAWSVLAAVLAIAVALTYSRTGVVLAALSLAVALWGIVWPKLGSRRGRILAVASVAAAVGVTVLASVERLHARFVDGLLGDLRWHYLARSWRVMGDYFPWGSGLGTFPGAYERNEALESLLSPAWSPGEYIFALYAHNEPLQVGIEAGLPGLVILLAFICIVAWGVFAILRKGQRADPWRFAAAISVPVPLLHSLVDSPLRTLACSAFLALALSLLSAPAHWQGAKTRRASS